MFFVQGQMERIHEHILNIGRFFLKLLDTLREFGYNKM